MLITEINQENITNETIKRVLFATKPQDFQEADCLIIFGCHIKPLLDERLSKAIELLKTNNINKVLVTGGVGVNGDFNESEYMKEHLLEIGVKESDILIEDKSTTTEENITNFIKILKANNLLTNKTIILVSNQIHFRRIGMELKKQLQGYNCHLIYQFKEDSLVSFDKVITDNTLRELAINEIKKIIRFVQTGLIDDEKI